MQVTKRSRRHYKKFESPEAYFTVGGWRDVVTIELHSKSSALEIETTVEEARNLLSKLSEALVRLEKQKESGQTEAA